MILQFYHFSIFGLILSQFCVLLPYKAVEQSVIEFSKYSSSSFIKYIIHAS